MKRLLLFLFAMVVGVAFADTRTINWYIDGQTYDTTTCEFGTNVTPPTPPAKYGYTFVQWQRSANFFDIANMAGANNITISDGVMVLNATNISTGKTLHQLASDLQVGDTVYCRVEGTTPRKYIWFQNGLGTQCSGNMSRTITQADLDGIVKLYCDTPGQTITSLIISTEPVSYTYLDYIESTGTQWTKMKINTMANGDVTVVADFEPTTIPATGQNAIFGLNGYFVAGYSRDGAAYNGGSTVAHFYSAGTRVSAKGIISLTAENGKYYVDNVDTGLAGRAYSGGGDVYIFTIAPPYTNYIPNGKLYGMTMTQNNQTIHNLRPARRNIDRVVGLYDTIDNIFYVSKGTDAFIAGPVASNQ